MSEEVVLKGNRFGIQIVFDEAVDFTVVLQKLQHKLDEARGFFGKGTTFLISDKVSDRQREALEELLQGFDMNLIVHSRQRPQAAGEKAASPVKTADTVSAEPEVKIVRGTLRSGQEIIWDGSVIVFGNVNPGARIVAGGNIIVKGTCRGIVYAGAHGDREATVIADKMLPGQIRIADLVACAPEQIEAVERVERAKIKGNNIVIEPVEEREVS